MRSKINWLSQFVLVGVIYTAVFKVSLVLGALMLVAHLTHEYCEFLAAKEMHDQILNARKILLDLDNSEEPPAREGNC